MQENDGKEILDLAEKWARAIVSNDAAAIGSFMADDRVIIGSEGATRKDDFLSLVHSGYLTHQMMQWTGEARVRIYGDTAVLTGRVINSGHFKGQAFSADEWTTDVFVRHGVGWLCALSHITPANCSPASAVVLQPVTDGRVEAGSDKARPSRFACLRGHAGRGMSTDEILALTRGATS